MASHTASLAVLLRPGWRVLLAALALGLVGCPEETTPVDDDDDSAGDDDDSVGDDDDDDTTPTVVDRGMYLSMAVADDGELVVSYYEREYGALWLARGDGSSWEHEPVDGFASDVSDVGWWTSIALAADGTEMIAYHDAADTALKFAQRTAEGWDITSVTGAGTLNNAGVHASLALDDSGNPAVAYYDARSNRLGIAWRTGDTWSQEYIDEGEVGPDAEAAGNSSADTGKTPRLYYVGGQWEVLYHDVANGDLRRAYGSPGSWATETLAGAGVSLGAWPSALHDGAQLTHIAFQELDGKTLILGSRNADGWSFSTVDGETWRGADSEIVLAGGQPAIVYQDGRDNDLMIATTDGANWTIDRLIEAGGVGYFNAAGVVGSTIHVATFDYTGRDFRTASR